MPFRISESIHQFHNFPFSPLRNRNGRVRAWLICRFAICHFTHFAMSIWLGVQLKSEYSQRSLALAPAADKCAELTVIRSVWRQMSQNLTRTFAAIQTGFAHSTHPPPGTRYCEMATQNGSLSLTRTSHTAQYCVGEGMSTGENYGLWPRQGASNFCIFCEAMAQKNENKIMGIHIFADALHVCRPTTCPTLHIPLARELSSPFSRQ